VQQLKDLGSSQRSMNFLNQYTCVHGIVAFPLDSLLFSLLSLFPLCLFCLDGVS
jgi:hypothetical protein